jgi:hypothetical protein
MRYQVDIDPLTQTLSIRELNLIVNRGSIKENMRRLRELVPVPAVLVYPYLGPRNQPSWDEIDKETLTEARIGQESFNDPATEKLDGFSEVDFPSECEIPEPIEGFGK